MYEPYGFSALTGQNAANTQAENRKPDMPGYTGLDSCVFADMKTPEDQIHWLYLYFYNMATTKADKDAVDEQFAKVWEAFNNFKESGFQDYYEQQIVKFINDNLERIFSANSRQVFFGLTSDGYFCAYVPMNWGDMVFDTGAVYGRSDYGRLILRYQVDAPNAIDNTYRYQLPGDIETTDSIISDLELIGRTLWTHMDSPVEGGR